MNKQIMGITIAVLIGITMAVLMWHQQAPNDSNKSGNTVVEKVLIQSNTQNTTQVGTSTLPNNSTGKQYSIGLSEAITIKSP